MGSEDLEQSLRAEVDDYINGRLSGMREEVTRLQSQLNEALTRLTEQLAGETQSNQSIAVTISEHMRRARNEGIETAASESSRTRVSSDVAILKAAVDDIDDRRTQAKILGALVNRAASFAPRVAFFIVKNENATGWRARGLEGTIGDDGVRELSLPLASDTLLSAVTKSRRTWSGAPGAHADDHKIFGHFGGNPPQRIVSVPLIARDKPVAVLYADCAEMDADAINLEALETLVRVSGMAVELLATKRPEAKSAAASAPAPATQATAHDAAPPAPAAYAGSIEEAPATDYSANYAAPAAPYEETVAPQAETTYDESTQSTWGESATPAVQETPTTSARNSYDDSPPGAGVGVADAASPAPIGGSRRYGSDTTLPIEVRDEEKQSHNAARRFARLLVSEIKLYNEQKVKEGRVEGDLYSRLREDIDRSRQMYDKRIAPEVTGRYDYFHQELVNTLAEGDPSKLGESYPGATVG
ncbi:MAG TPA: GAF domain-containing protein [Pyrinomonadaceae bacterium]|nr:GAF domain-containing protein [Pyrinomonadaceae bacterium]